MDDFLEGAKSVLNSIIYPEISDILTISIPTTVVIDGSTYRIPVIALPTPSTTSPTSSSLPFASSRSSTLLSSTSSSNSQTSPTTSDPGITPAPTPILPNLNVSPSEAASTATPSPGQGPDRRLGIILGVTLSLLALIVAAALIWFAYRRKKRTGYWLKHNPPPSDEEVDTWRGNEKGMKQKPTSSFFVRPLNHATHIWSDHSGNDTRYRPISDTVVTASEPVQPGNPGKGDPWAGAAGLPGGTGARRLPSIAEREVTADETVSASVAPVAAASAPPSKSRSPDATAPSTNPNPFANTSPSNPSPLSQPPLTASPPSLPTVPAAAPAPLEYSHNTSRAATAAGLGTLAGAAAVRHERKSQSASRSRSRGAPARRSGEFHPVLRPSGEGRRSADEDGGNDESRRRRSSSSAAYPTEPEELAAEMTVNDGPYARASRASWGSWRRRSGGDVEAQQVAWRQTRDMGYEAVPDPYPNGMSGGGVGAQARRKSWAERTGLETKGANQVQQPMPTLPAHLNGHPKKAGDVTEEPRGRSETVISSRSSISRKPVPASTLTDVQLPRQQQQRYSDPFASPADVWADGRDGSSKYARGDYEEDHEPVPLLPKRSPQRRYSPSIHYPTGPEVSQFNFGLTNEELRGLRQAGGRRSIDDVGRTWSFERGQTGV